MEKQIYTSGECMKILLMLCLSLFLTSCTFSVTLVHTEGQATDVVDETASNAPTVTPTLNIPVKAV